MVRQQIHANSCIYRKSDGIQYSEPTFANWANSAIGALELAINTTSVFVGGRRVLVQGIPFLAYGGTCGIEDFEN